MADIDKELAKLLQNAKRKPHNYAIISKGPAVLDLIVKKKPIKDGEIKESRRTTGGNQVTQGVVIGGDGPELVFQTVAEPAVGEVRLRKFVTDSTGLTLKTTFQVVAELVEVDDDSPDDDVNSGKPTPPVTTTTPDTAPPVPPPPPPSPEAIAFAERWKALQPGVKKVAEAAVKVGSINLGEAAQERSDAARNAFASKDLPGAMKSLEDAEKLVLKGLQLLSSGESPESLFKARFAKLHPLVKQRLAAGGPDAEQGKLKFSQAGVAGNKKSWEEANELLDQVEQWLKTSGGTGAEQPPGDASPPPPPPRSSVATEPNQKLLAALRALAPDIFQAVRAYPDRKAELEGLRGQVERAIKGGALDDAQKSLKQLQDQLKSLSSVSLEAALEFRDNWLAAFDEWDQAVAAVNVQMAELGEYLASSDDEDLQQIAEFGLGAVTQSHLVPLRAALMELAASSPDRLRASAKRVQNLVDAFKKHVESSEVVAACDTNPFGVSVSIRQTLAPGFAALERGIAPVIA